jgi:hypothetical protein
MRTYICIFCDDVKGERGSRSHCDGRGEPGNYSHVWQVHRDKMPVDEAQERAWEDNTSRQLGLS